MRQTPAIARFAPTLLARNLTATLLRDTARILVVLLGLYATIDLVELRAAGTPNSVLLSQYWLKLPSIAVLMMPPAAAVAAALRTATLRRTGEWDAMHGLGISPGTTFRRLLLVPILIGAGSFGISGRIAPLATARFEAAVRGFSEGETGGEPQWTRQDIGFARIDKNGRVDRVIQLNGDGFPVARWSRLPDTEGTRSSRWRVWDEHGEPAARPVVWNEQRFDRPAAAPAGNLLAGQSLTFGGLSRAIAHARRAGLSAGPFRAERGLRIAAAAACAVVPATVLAFLLLFQTERAWRAAAVSVLVTALYWCAAAVVWNGVSTERQPETALSFGVPFGFVLLSGFTWKATARFRHTRHRPLGYAQ